MNLNEILLRSNFDITRRSRFNTIFLSQTVIGSKLNLFYEPRDISRNQLEPSLRIKLRLVDHPIKADYILVPHDWIEIYRNKKYLKYLGEISKLAPLIILNGGDVSPTCKMTNTIQLRTHLHSGEKYQNKIIIPYPIKSKELTIKNWKPVPTISFIGYIPKFGFGTLTGYNKFFIKHPIQTSYFLNRSISFKKLKNLSKEFEIIAKSRSSFTLRAKNLKQDLHLQEYNQSLQTSDYVLCPRGFANTSMRFYESLSAGITPILIDSGGELPMISNTALLKKNILRVNLFGDWARAILRDWQYLEKNSNYEKRQINNFNLFKNELNLTTYLENLFSEYLC
jgi:hypothetical protein